MSLKRLKKFFKRKYPNSWDKLDIDAVYDKTLTYDENKHILQDRFDNLIPKEVEQNKAEQEEFEKQMALKELEHLKKEQKKALKKIRNSTSPEIEKYFKTLKEFVRIAVKSKAIHSLFVIGKCGLGKSYSICQELANKDFEYVLGNISPLALYILLHKNKDGIVFFDDTQGLLKNESSMSVLFSALWSSTGKRIISWHTTSGKLKDIPTSFEFTGKILFSMNEVPKGEQFKTLLSRCFSCDLEFSYSEILAIMYEISKLNNGLNIDVRKSIVDWIANHTDATTKDFNLRLQAKVEDLYNYSQNNGIDWKKLALTFIKPNPELQLIKQLIEKGYSIEQQIKRFAELTGLSRATYYRRRKDLSQSLNRNKLYELS